jgi:hypothetical protein
MSFKTGIANRALKPMLGIVDTYNTDSCSKEIHIAAGLDVLFHSLESYTAIPCVRAFLYVCPVGANMVYQVHGAQPPPDEPEVPSRIPGLEPYRGRVLDMGTPPDRRAPATCRQGHRGPRVQAADAVRCSPLPLCSHLTAGFLGLLHRSRVSASVTLGCTCATPCPIRFGSCRDIGSAVIDPWHLDCRTEQERTQVAAPWLRCQHADYSARHLRRSDWSCRFVHFALD